MKRGSLALVILLFSSSVFAGGKADYIVNTCEGKVTKKEAVKYIKRVFLACSEGTRVQIGSCSIQCQKKTIGATVGK